MLPIVQHPLWEKQLVSKIIEFVDGEGIHPDYPILIEEPEPDLVLNFISFNEQNNGDEQFFVRLKNNGFTRKSWNYMTRNFPNLVLGYFTQIAEPPNLYWEDWDIIETISWRCEKDLVRYFLIAHFYGHRYWVSSTFIHANFPNFVLWEHLYLRNK